MIAEYTEAEVKEWKRKADLYDHMQYALTKIPDALDAEWQSIANARPMEAVKLCRKANSYSLMEARSVVETYIGRKL